MTSAALFAVFGGFMGGVMRGWFDAKPGPVKRDKTAPKDDEAGKNRRARERIRRNRDLPQDI